MLGTWGLLLVFVFAAVKADLVVYTDDTLPSPWQDWSWGSTINYDATDIAEGSSSISVTSTAYSALSLYNPTPFPNYAGLSFDISGDQPDLSIQLQDTADSTSSSSVALSVLSSTVTSNNFTHVLLDFNNVPPTGASIGNGTWDRITFQAGGNGATFHIDNILLLSEITVVPQFLSAEPIANNLIAVTTTGDVDLSTVKVLLNGKNIAIKSNTTTSPVNTPSKSITYLSLASSLAPGNLNITTGNGTFSFVLPAKTNTNIDQSNVHAISDLIYGINFPTDASYIEDQGVTLSRWGGNAVTAYNPFGDFTNAGADWYFENRAADDGNCDAWIGWISAAGSDTLVAIPALDWVAKDTTSYSYPKSVYPDQQAFDPYNGDAGDGLLPNGSFVTPPPQSNVYAPWNTTAAFQWLSNLVHKPTIVTIDNEIEIASSTHQDMHPDPMGYDEELARVINFSTIAKQALPDVQVAAPSTDSWWFYWTSEIGFEGDTALHNNTDFLPWFLQQMQAHDKSTGKRLLDFLDIHYYFAADTSANDAAAKALRLRMTRSLWDPTYVDESWIGTSAPQSHQPDPTIVQLIPRMQALIAENYPGTKLSISEWDSTNDADVTGGLATADSLGIFGKYGVDAATYWEDPDANSAAALAFWLFRGNGATFGDQSIEANVTGFDPDLIGVYAAQSSSTKKKSVVIINKDPSNPIGLNLSGVPTGTYVLRHFGGLAGVAKWQTTTTLAATNYIVVPAYTAVFLSQQ